MRVLKIVESAIYVGDERATAVIPADFAEKAVEYNSEHDTHLVDDITPVIMDFLHNQFELTEEEKPVFEAQIKEDLFARVE